MYKKNRQKNSIAMTFSFRIVIVLLSFPQFSKYFATADKNGLELNSQSKFWEYIKEYSNRRDQNLYPPYGITKQVNGNWGHWNDWSKCFVTCGDGKRIRTRHCNRPIPQFGGLFCDHNGSTNFEVGDCNHIPCEQNENCQNTEELCNFISQYDCNDNLVKRKCPKTCNTCHKDFSQTTNRRIDLNNATCTLDKSDVSQQCATDDTTVRKLFDLRNRCSEFGPECEPECECKRKLAKDTASKYYKLKSKLKKKSYSRMTQAQESNTDQGYGGIEPAYAMDASGYDANQHNLKEYQTSSDMYLDYTNGKVVSIKPDHPYYKKTSAIEIRDPTCRELQSVMVKICTGEQEKDERNLPINEHSVGLVCGMGTTWNTKFQVCEKVPKQISDVDGTGQPFEEPTYPAIRPSGYKTPFDDPNRKFAESNLKVPDILTQRQLRQQRQSCGCRVNRCRYPLTSRDGRNQARIFVQLFKTIYQYQDCNRQYPDDHVRKCALQYELRKKVDVHFEVFNSLHDGLILFLPWHRWYLIEVERILLDAQKEFDGFTRSCNDTFLGIPYFDWHNLKPYETPMTFVNDEDDLYGHHLHDSLGQRTYPRCHFSGRCPINDGELAWLPRVGWSTGNAYVIRDWKRYWSPLSNLATSFHPQFLLPTQFEEFSCELEGKCSGQYNLHDFVHKIVGGDMFSDMSANDPLFYVHHANIDKIWDDWQKQSDEHRNYYPGYKNQPIGLQATGTVQDFLDLLKIKYTSPIEQSIVNNLAIEYVDMDTSDDWGRGNTLTIDLESQELARRELDDN